MIIHKYRLLPGAQTIPMPEDAVVLKAHEQHGEVTLWAEHDNGEMQPRAFLVLMTGQEFANSRTTRSTSTQFSWARSWSTCTR